MKTSDVLRRAKKFLGNNWKDVQNCRDTKERFICLTLDRVRNKVTDKKCDRIQRLVDVRLRGYPTLESWLRHKHGVSANDYNNSEYIDRMQLTRHKWINSMIAEFVAKGD